MENRTVRRLEIVRNTQSSAAKQGPSIPEQKRLFPFGNSLALVFVCFPEVTEEEFRRAIELASPAVIVELRRAPRFDLGKMDRQAAFAAFNRQGSLYLDLNDEGKSDILQHLRSTILKHRKDGRPIMFLISRAQGSYDDLSKAILNLVKNTGDTWETYCIPDQFSRSHATIA